MKLLDKIIGPEEVESFCFLFQVKVFRLFGYLFEALMLSSIVTLIVSFICMFFTKNEGIINVISTFVFVSLLLSSYKRSKADFLAFEKMLKKRYIEEQGQK